jgi:hypothetical protein
MTDEVFDAETFEAATELVAKRLAFFRTDDFDAEPTDNERLLAGHLIGGLLASDFIKKPVALTSTVPHPEKI